MVSKNKIIYPCPICVGRTHSFKYNMDKLSKFKVFPISIEIKDRYNKIDHSLMVYVDKNGKCRGVEKITDSINLRSKTYDSENFKDTKNTTKIGKLETIEGKKIFFLNN